MSACVHAWRLYWVQGRSFTSVASEVGLAPNTLSKCWAHWGFPKRRPGPRRIRRVLSDSDIEKILELVQSESMASVARRFNVSRQAVGQMVRRYRR